MHATCTLAHISDLHATPVVPGGIGPLLGKRASGWLSWQLRRKRAHRPPVLEALIEDLEAQAPDRIAVTGDLTNVALEQEFVEAHAWLARLGTPSRVMAVPGNHDAYVRMPEERALGLWTAYLESDAEGAALLTELLEGEEKPEALMYPTLRLAGGLALVGLSSALPTPLFRAWGDVGAAQRDRLGRVLAELGTRGYARVLLIHHPPVPGVVGPRRALRDAEAVAELLRQVGAELVLHGHLHRTHVATLPGPVRPIPVVGVPSASDVGHRPDRRARYHLYQLSREPDGRLRIAVRVRGYDPATGRFAAEPSLDDPALVSR